MRGCGARASQGLAGAESPWPGPLGWSPPDSVTPPGLAPTAFSVPELAPLLPVTGLPEPAPGVVPEPVPIAAGPVEPFAAFSPIVAPPA
ncbi:MAG TPA: hypothetical protein VND97_03540 [Beijerinckiaceae bacterium]|nr:hypothetical protein [Beijerinckiaceae bacterium]